MYKWHNILQNYKFISKKTLESAYYPYTKKYGYGWTIDSIAGKRRVAHSGSFWGFRSNFARITEDDMVVILLSNFEVTGLNMITNDIFSALGFDFHFIRLNFSDEMNENGKLKFVKIWRLFIICSSILKNLMIYRPDYVYYPPSGPEKIPVYRDLILVFLIKLFKNKVIFHFHAGGLSEIYPTLNRSMQWLFRFCFFNPDYAICMSSYGKKDPEFLKAKCIEIIPYGVQMDTVVDAPIERSMSSNITILFVGVCRETKGILDFIQVIQKVHTKNSAVKGRVLGTVFSEKEKKAINLAVDAGFLDYEGVKIGKEKDQVFSESDIFLFPTFFEHENFPTVNLEAFAHGLPVISTKWRGVQDQVCQGENGYIHDVHDIDSMANSILTLTEDSDLYKRLSLNARQEYVRLYTAERFETNVTNFFNKLS
ncbi:MAG: glycosyltransferase [Flavobacterium sp.]|nr:MAG: glycosyltransferase [Flavobacterium sp.]